MVSRLTLGVAIGSAAAVATVGIAAAVSRTIHQPPPPPTCSCPSPDVCPTNGVCPSGYSQDPNNSSCCAPSSTSQLLWSLGGGTGPLSLPCTNDCTSVIAVQITGLTPNGPFGVYAAYDPSQLGQIGGSSSNICSNQNPNVFCPYDPTCIVQNPTDPQVCNPPETYTADAFGNYAATWYELGFCCCAWDYTTAPPYCFIPPQSFSGAGLYYMAVMDLTTKSLSNVISIYLPEAPTSTQDCGCTLA